MNTQLNSARETRYYTNIHELASTSELSKANELLKQGWELLAIKEETETKVREGQLVTESKPVFIFGRILSTQEPSTSQDNDIEFRLESLPWKPSASGRCDFVKDPPGELLEIVRNSKNGIKGKTHHFAAHKTDAVLFRFKRKEGEIR